MVRPESREREVEREERDERGEERRGEERFSPSCLQSLQVSVSCQGPTPVGCTM